MKKDASRVAVIGGGIAGLCAAVYAARCGYQPEVFEMHESVGGLATSWRRGEYTFETCLHWLLGSRPGSAVHSKWMEIFNIDSLKFVHHEEFVRIEDDNGDCLKVYSDINQLEMALLKRAPQDGHAIQQFAEAVRRLGHFELPDSSTGWLNTLRTLIHDAPQFLLLHELSKVSARQYGNRFTDPLIRGFFADGESAGLSSLAVLFSLAWMNNHDADYAIGGSQAVIQAISETLNQLGGKLHCGRRVEEILVRNNAAIGVRLSDGTVVESDWVISAADGHTTIFNLLHGKYVGDEIANIYNHYELFPSYAQVSFGIRKDLSNEPAFLTRRLKRPLYVDPATMLAQVSFRFFHFDPTFAPKGKTAVTCFLPTNNYQYWLDLARNQPSVYITEKERLLNEVLLLLDERIPGISSLVDATDVSTPATVIRCTGNWQGSMQGWLLTPGTGLKQLPMVLPGLERFLMVGQWVEPGGGLPSGLFTSRAAVREMCRKEGVPFLSAQRG